MGNRGLLRALQRIQSQVSKETGTIFGQIILAAPDLDADLFRDLAHTYRQLGQRTTVYVSPKNKAVGISKMVTCLSACWFMSTCYYC